MLLNKSLQININENIKLRNNLGCFFIYFILCFFIYFNKMDKFIEINKKLIIFIFIFSILLLILNIYKINTKRIHFLWIISSLGMLLSCIFSIDKMVSLKFFIMYNIGILIMCFFSWYFEASILNMKIHKYYSTLFLIFTFIPIMNMNFYYYIVNKIFNIESVQIILFLTRSGRYVGIGKFAGNNAFLISVGLGFAFCDFMFTKKKIKGIVVTSIFIIGIFLTGSRSIVIASIISIIFLVIITSKDIKKILKNICIISIILIPLIALITILIPQASNILERFKSGNQSIDNRLILYKYAIELFKSNPILGNGINTFLGLTYSNFKMVENTYVHNIILQLLAESGLVGTIMILFPFFATWKMTMDTLKKCIKFSINKKIIKVIMISLYIQNIIIIYFFTGNPIYDYNILLTYFIFISIPIGINSNIKIKFEE